MADGPDTGRALELYRHLAGAHHRSLALVVFSALKPVSRRHVCLATFPARMGQTNRVFSRSRGCLVVAFALSLALVGCGGGGHKPHGRPELPASVAAPTPGPPSTPSG